MPLPFRCSDPARGSRYYILGAFADEARDEALAYAYGLRTETPAAFLPGEEALLSGAGELQEAERRDHYGDVFTWLAPNVDGSGALRAVYDFCDGEEPFDDMAVLALCRK